MWSLHITELVWIWNSPLDLPNSGIEPGSPTLQVDSLPFEPQEKPLLCYMGLKIWKPARCEDKEICEEPHSVAGALTNTSLRPWSLLKDFTWTTVLSNSVKLSHSYGATQDGQVMVERSDRMWSTGEGNGKPLQCSCFENPMNSRKRQNDRILKEELPRSVGAQYATGDQWKNNSRKN